MANLLVNPSHQAKKSYNSFPMNHTLDMTNTTGQLIPVFFDYLNAGDKFTLETPFTTRTQPLAAPAHAELDECIDTFFVPMNQILQIFGDWYNNIKDFKSDFYASAVSNVNRYKHLPSINPHTFFKYICTQLGNGTLANKYTDMLRLMDAFHIPIARYCDILGTNFEGTQTFTMFPYFFLAYQKIYFDYYRLSDREDIDPAAYNVDSLMAGASSATHEGGSTISNARAEKFFTLRYVPYRKDFFRNLFVSPAFPGSAGGGASIGAYGVDLSEVRNWLGSDDFAMYAGDKNGGTTDALDTFGVLGDGTSAMRSTSFTTFNLRSMFAVEKMLEITRRSAKHYDAQTLAHLGIKVPTGIAGEVMFLNHYEQELAIGDVISTTDTYDAIAGTGAPLGELAGKGYSSGKTAKGSSKVLFTAPCEGVAISLYYAMPKIIYQNFGLDKQHVKVKISDWWRPELDNLGMQPLFAYQSDIRTAVSDILGWQYAWSEHKMKYNLAIGDVSKFGSKPWWVLSSDNMLGNQLSNFMSHARLLNPIMLYPFQYVNPYNVGTTTTPASIDYKKIYNSDPLIHTFYLRYTKASEMSAYSLMSM